MNLTESYYWAVCRSPAAQEVLAGRRPEIGDWYITDDNRPCVFDGRRAILPVGAAWTPDLDYLMDAICSELCVKWVTALQRVMRWVTANNPTDKFGADQKEVLLKYLIHLRTFVVTAESAEEEELLPALSRDKTLLNRGNPW